MSFEITTAHVVQYKATLMELLRQKGSRLRNTVMLDTQIVGTSKFGEQHGPGIAKKKTTRHSPMPFTPSEHKRRKYNLFFYEYADLIDKDDQLKTLIDPTNAYVIDGRDAMGHAMDDEIITALTGDAFTGAAGTDVTTLPGTQKVAVDYVKKGTQKNSGLTVFKLREARRILRTNNVPEDGELFAALRARQIEDLLDDDEITSRDYTTLRAIQSGTLENELVMGFRIKHSERINFVAATDIASVPCWWKNAAELGIGMDVMADVSRRNDLSSLPAQVYFAMYIGAARFQEKGVVEISCDETPPL